MRFTSSLVAIAATLCAVQADFMVYTVPPIPTDAIPSFTDQAAVRFLLHRIPPSTNITAGFKLDDQRLSQWPHRLQLLHQVPRLHLPILTHIRRIRDRRLRFIRFQLQHTSCCDR